MITETYMPVFCPAKLDDKNCNRLLVNIAHSHHNLFSVTCPSCGTFWRIFHGANDSMVELSLCSGKNQQYKEPVLMVSLGFNNVKKDDKG